MQGTVAAPGAQDWPPGQFADLDNAVTMEVPMRLRTLIPGILLALLAASAVDARADATEPLVSCDRIVLRDRVGNEDGYRILLDAVSVPGARSLAGETVQERAGGWRHFRSAGLAIHAGTSLVSVSVPQGWRNRVALSWGGSRPSSTIRFATCSGSARGAWSFYSGRIHLSRRADCVPLQVTVGGTSTTLRVGVGRVCGRF